MNPADLHDAIVMANDAAIKLDGEDTSMIDGYSKKHRTVNVTLKTVAALIRKNGLATNPDELKKLAHAGKHWIRITKPPVSSKQVATPKPITLMNVPLTSIILRVTCHNCGDAISYDPAHWDHSWRLTDYCPLCNARFNVNFSTAGIGTGKSYKHGMQALVAIVHCFASQSDNPTLTLEVRIAD